jgi:prepilin-type N-terminal cleavage/methylation domain-containing protein/prepilin-type processing-associated H-X9-DG protein
MRRQRRSAFTLVELLVAVAIAAVLAGLTLSAVQAARAAALRSQCQNQLRQLGHACLLYHDQHGSLPRGFNSGASPARDPHLYQSWHAKILPYLEQEALARSIDQAYRLDPVPFHNPPHVHFPTPVRVFGCLSDPRTAGPQWDAVVQKYVSLTSYLGVSGTDYASRDGVLFMDSNTRMADVTDGTSNTLLVGERPPGPDYDFGWWYAGLGQLGTGSADMILGAREQNLLDPGQSPCVGGAYWFRPSTFADPCGIFHFWSPHAGGANFGFADGSVRFLGYSASSVLPALATRAGGEVVGSD